MGELYLPPSIIAIFFIHPFLFIFLLLVAVLWTRTVGVDSEDPKGKTPLKTFRSAFTVDFTAEGPVFCIKEWKSLLPIHVTICIDFERGN